MRYRSWQLVTPLLLFAAGLASGACLGSGGGESGAGGVPTATPPATLPEPLIVGETLPPAEGTIYIVQAGDTLSDIADQFGTTVEAITEANNIEDPRRLFVGQELRIPGIRDNSNVLGATAEPPTPAPTAAPRPTASGDSCTYSVRSGDIAVRIASNYGITTEELAALNGTTVADLRSLSVGDVLIVPCTSPSVTPAPATPTPPGPTVTPSGSGCTYTVQSGDIAVDIAADHGITVEQLAALNGTTVADLATLQVGDVLTVPCP